MPLPADAYGLTTADFTMTAWGRIEPDATGTVWDEMTGGTRVTDLLTLDGAPITEVTSDASGRIGFRWPTGNARTAWLDFGVGGRVAVRPVSITGGQGNPGPPGPSQPTGTGAPEGVRAGTVGDVWVQTGSPTAVGGILVWRKRTGTGTTGWVVVEGETPWYPISSLLVNGWTTDGGVFHIRRTPQGVTLWSATLVGSSATSETFLPDIPGFTPDWGFGGQQALVGPPDLSTVSDLRELHVGAGTGWRIRGYSTASDKRFRFHTHAFATSAAWPTVAPA